MDQLRDHVPETPSSPISVRIRHNNQGEAGLKLRNPMGRSGWELENQGPAAEMSQLPVITQFWFLISEIVCKALHSGFK